MYAEHPLRRAAAAAAAGLLPAAAPAALPDNLEVTGAVASEMRWHFDAPLDAPQHNGASFSLSLEPEFFWDWRDANLSLLISPFLRLDRYDGGRTHFDLREMLFRKVYDNWELKFGVGKVFWGVTESRHLVDIVNQTDLVENIDGEDKLGQPMLNLTWINNWGNFNFFLLPYFRERTFPGAEGRLRSLPRVDTARPLYESGAEQWHPDFAFRYNNYFGNMDIGLSYFYGASRDPLFQLTTGPNNETLLQPVYNLIHQGGLEVQYTTGGWLFKFEGMARSGDGHDFQALAGGYEYTFVGVLNSPIDVGVLTEYHFDSRGDNADSIFNHDIFAGMRITLNDEKDTALLGGAFYDHDNGTKSYRVEFERRIGNRYKLVIEAQKFAHAYPGDPSFSLRNDSFLQIELRRYF